MTTFFQLIRQQIKREFAIYKGKFKNKKSLVSIITIGVVYLLVVLAMAVIFRLLVAAFEDIGMAKELLVVTILLVQSFQLLVGVARVNTFFDISQNSKVLSTAPIQEGIVFFAKITLVFLYQLVVCWSLMLPLLLVYASVLRLGVSFYLRSIITLILMPILPMFLSVILAFPVQLLSKLLERMVILRLMLVVLMLIFLLLSYINLLRSFQVALIFEELSLVMKQSTLLRLIRISSGFVFAQMLANISLNIDVINAVLLNVIICIPIGIIAVVCSRHLFPKIKLRQQKQKKLLRIVRPKRQSRNPIVSLLKKEFLVALRNPNYGFFYFGMMICVPILAYFTMDFLQEIAITLYSARIMPSIAIFVLVMYSMLTNLYATSTISREGASILISKSIPVSYRKQVFAKTLFAAASPLVAVYITCLVMIFTAQLVWYYGLLLLLISCIMVIGRVCDAILKDLKKPLLSSSNDTKSYDGINWSLVFTVLSGMAIAVLIGISCFILCAISSEIFAYLLYLAFALMFSAPTVLRLYEGAHKYYSRIYWS